MKSYLKPGKRLMATMTALTLLCCSVLHDLTPTASAVGANPNTYESLYEFIAEKCYSNNDVAGNILSSGALVATDEIQLFLPSESLISVNGSNLIANRCSSGLNNQSWTPITYAINGNTQSFNGSTSVALDITGAFHVDVIYQLSTGISLAMLDLPATLATEAASQITVLNHLISADNPYMGYMEQMDDAQMGSLYDILDPEYAFANYIVLSKDRRDTQKNTALKNSFREVIRDMRANCYLDDGTLTFYDLLLSYEEYGLLHYYQNSTQYLTEVALFNQYLDRMLGEETRDGVYLSAEDKEYAIGVMVNYAESFGYIEGDVTLDFVDLRDNVSTANAMLLPPNENINLSNSTKLKTLTDILASDAVEEGQAVGDEEVIQWNSMVSAYGRSLTLTKIVGANLEIQETDTGTDNDNSSSDDDNTGDDNNSGGDNNTGSDDSSDDDSNTGGNSSDNNTSGGITDSNTSYISTAGSLKSTLTNASNGETVCITSAITMTEDITVSKTINITGAKRLDDTNHILTLSNTTASITADAPLNVASGVDGYVPVKSESGYKYTLTEVQHPEIGGKAAGSKTETLNSTRYLYLDLDPTNGMTLNAFRTSTAFDQLDGHTVSIAIKGNDGSALIKTADRMTVTARNSDGKTVAQITYVIIVMGDSNCNGKVNSSDAAVTKSISMGNQSSLEVRMAADVNFSGTLETPKINSSDVSYIMAKWFAWDLNKYVSNLK